MKLPANMPEDLKGQSTEDKIAQLEAEPKKKARTNPQAGLPTDSQDPVVDSRPFKNLRSY